MSKTSLHKHSDRLYQNEESIRSRLIKRIDYSVLATSLGVALLAVLVFWFPVNRVVMTGFRNEFRSAVEVRATIVDLTVDRFIKATDTLVSRTAIRERLYEYTQGNVDFSEVVRFTAPKYRDGATVLNDLIAARRTLVDGTVVTDFGRNESFGSIPNTEPGVYLVSNTEDPTIAVVCSIVESGETIGYDSTVFEATSILGNPPEEVREFSLLETPVASNSDLTSTVGPMHHIELESAPFTLVGRADEDILANERREVLTGLVAYTVLLFAAITVLFYFTMFRFGKRLIDRLVSANHEKSVLLRESIHRIKNSFVSIEGLLTLKRQAEPSPEAVRALQEALTVVSSNRLLYEKLLRTEDSDHARITTRPYLTDLAQSTLQAFSAGRRIQLKLDIDDMPLDSSQAFPLGAITTELLTNIIKYAYPEQEFGGGQESGVAEIGLKPAEVNGKAILTVRDKGRGFPDTVDPVQSDSFGLNLVRSLAEQVQGSMQVDTSEGEGTRVTVRLSLR